MVASGRSSSTGQSFVTTSEINKLVDVFGTSRSVPLTYVQRPGVDDRFLQDITRDKHIVIHGSSKQGKTCLRKFHLKEEDYVLIQCTREATKSSLYEMLLKQAGVRCEVSHSETIRGTRKLHVTLKGEVGIPLIAKAGGDGGAAHEKTAENSTDSKELDLDPDDPNDVVRVLRAAKFSKCVVVEDFHYLDEEVQRSLAVDLKVFHEISSLVFIVVGVWLEANRLTLYNGDLTGRVSVINADHWTSCQLEQIVAAGALLLNITIAPDVCREIVSGCQDNVGLLQEVCYRICEHANVHRTQVGAKTTIGSVGDVQAMLRAVSDEQSARYRNFLARFVEGLGQTQLEMYKWIGYAIVSSSPEELRRGIRPNVLFHKIRGKHPSGTLQQNNVVQALERVGAVQYKHKLQPLILDFSNGELVVVDANFLLFMQTHSRSELLECLGMSDEIDTAQSRQ